MDRPFSDRLPGADGPAPPRISQLVADLKRAGTSERISVADILTVLDGRAFGVAALLFTLPVCVPMPPGVPTVAGVALLLIALQIAVGQERLWLPAWLYRKSVKRDAVRNAVDLILPRLKSLETVSRPRLSALTGAAGRRFVGGVLIVLATMLILPIPIFGNMPLAAAASVVAFSLVERDGLLLLVGYGLTAVALAVTSSMGWLAVVAISRII